MIVKERTNDVTTEGVGTTTKFQMKVCGAGFRIISDGIYTRKAEAVLREICCNGWDAHLDVDNPDPIIVHLPTRLEPWFECKDNGPGLSDDDVRQVFGTYFESTKTHSNKFTGAKGLGSKSPFCLDDVSSYTVISRYEGVKTTYAMYLDESDEPVITDLSREDTDEPNGVTVHVPVPTDQIDDFERAAVRVFQWFDPVPVLNVSSVIARIDQEKGAQGGVISDGDQFSIDEGYGDLYIIMGNVAYKDDTYYGYDHPLNRIKGWIRVDMGDMEVDAGRENITSTKANRAVIDGRIETIGERLCTLLPELIEAEPSTWEQAVKAEKFVALAKKFNISLKKYRKNYNDLCTRIKIYYKQGGNRTSTMNAYNIHSFCDHKMYVSRKGYEKRLRYHVREDGDKKVWIPVTLAIKMNIPPHLLTEPSTLSPIPKKPRQSNGSTTTSSGPRVRKTTLSVTTWRDCWSPSDRWGSKEVDIECDEPRIYVKLDRYDPDVANRTIEMAVNVFGITVYGIRKNIQDRKSWQGGNWIHLSEWLPDALKNYDGTKYRIEEHSESTIKMFKALKDCKDPAIGELYEKLTSARKGKDYEDLCERLGVDPAIKTHDLKEDVIAIKEKYRLLNKWSGWDSDYYMKDFVQYIHAVYTCGESDNDSD